MPKKQSEEVVYEADIGKPMYEQLTRFVAAMSLAHQMDLVDAFSSATAWHELSPELRAVFNEARKHMP